MALVAFKCQGLNVGSRSSSLEGESQPKRLPCSAAHVAGQREATALAGSTPEPSHSRPAWVTRHGLHALLSLKGSMNFQRSKPPELFGDTLLKFTSFRNLTDSLLKFTYLQNFFFKPLSPRAGSGGPTKFSPSPALATAPALGVAGGGGNNGPCLRP